MTAKLELVRQDGARELLAQTGPENRDFEERVEPFYLMLREQVCDEKLVVAIATVLPDGATKIIAGEAYLPGSPGTPSSATLGTVPEGKLVLSIEPDQT